MSDHPIIFRADEVQATLDGRKTQTRRTRGLDYINEEPDIWEPPFFNQVTRFWEFLHKRDGDVLEIKCPYGKVGDRLWVREGYQISEYSFRRNCVGGKYLADNKEFWTEVYQREYDLINNRKKPYAKTSGRFMYKSLARIWLEITDIRVERVQDISEEDAMAEGVEPNCVSAHYVEDVGYIVRPNELCPACKPKGVCQSLCNNEWIDYRKIDGCGHPAGSAEESFQTLWDSLNAKRGYSWELNPWVRAIEFKLIEKGGDK